MKSRRKGGDFPAAAALGLFVFAGLLRFVKPENAFFEIVLFYFITFLYFGLILCWMVYVRKRFISRRLRRLLLCMAVFLLFYIFLRTIRYRCVSPDTGFSRFLWYLYYLPQIFAPLLSFVAAFCVGRAEDEKPSGRWWAALLAAAVLSVGVLTNDFHQLAFRFQPDFADWNTDYSYGILFYLVTVWIYAFLAASLVKLYHKCRISSVRQRAWLPFIWIAVGTLFVVILALESVTGIEWLFRLPETHCFILIAIWESCIRIGLVPSNVEYNDFFSHSSLDVQIADTDGKVVYASETAEPLTKKQMQPATEKPVLLRKNTLLRSNKVFGGHIFWTEDLTAVNTMNEQLREIGEHLSQESDLLKAENEIREQRAKLEEQNRLYDSIAVFLKPYLDRIDRLIADESDFKDNLKTAMVLNCYCKRRANLILLGDTKESLPAKELYLCINESCEYLKLCGVSCFVGLPQDFTAPKEHTGFAFDFWQLWVDRFLGSLTAVTADILPEKNGLCLKLCADTAAGTVDEEQYADTLASLGGSVSINREDETLFVCLRLGEDGDEA